jgi:membrane dipeptidase
MTMDKRRRRFLKSVPVMGAVLAGFPAINFRRYRLFNNSAREYSDRAIRLLQEAIVVDLLGSFLDGITKRNGRTLEDLWFLKPSQFTEEDYRAVKASGIDLFAFGELPDNPLGFLERTAQLNGFIASNSHFIERIDCKRKLSDLNGSDKIGLMISYQDSSHFEELGDVDKYYALGQRISQITYNPANKLGCGAFVGDDTGLTEYGAQVIKRMNAVGMAVDLSHCGDKTTLDGISASKKTVLFTHASCRALNPGYPRSKTDEAIVKMAQKGGVVGIPVIRFMLKPDEPVTVQDFLDHIDHVVRLAGVEHVGIGSDAELLSEDFLPLEVRKSRVTGADPKYRTHSNDQFLICVEGIDHPLRMFDIAEGLITRGYTDEQIKMILGGNFVRALNDIFID